MSDPVVEVKSLEKTFRVGFRRKKVPAVRGVSFQVFDNEIVGIIGPNGAGKTSTIKMLIGLVKPDAGTATIFGRPARDVHSRDRLGYLPEGPYFYEHLRVPELLRFYGQLFGLRGPQFNKRIDELLELVGLSHATDRPLRKFSKGMRQRAGIAQALINDPQLVILDEPQTGLDPTGRREVRDLIAGLKDQGKTIMFSSHILPDVEAVCDRVIVMSHGRVVDEGRISALAGDQVTSWEVIVRGPIPSTVQSMFETEETRGDHTLLRLNAEGDVRKALTLLLAESELNVISVTPERVGLEDLYMRET
jgi:ABC-2 type transport system ATP-binding protein